MDKLHFRPINHSIRLVSTDPSKDRNKKKEQKKKDKNKENKNDGKNGLDFYV